MSWHVASKNHDFVPSGAKVDFSGLVISCRLQRPTYTVFLGSWYC